MNRPDCKEIAGNLELWLEYVGPGEPDLASDDFNQMTFDEKLEMIHELWPADCNCTSMLIVQVTADCEELIGTLPRGYEWALESEDYADDGTGIITINFKGGDLTAAAEQALDTNPDVISYSVA